MSSAAELKWFFSPTYGSHIQGFHDSAGEHFTGNYENYLAREVIQNSLDAHLDKTAPVRVVFEYSNFPVSELPCMGEYREILKRVKDFTAATNQEGAPEYFGAAAKRLEKDSLPVLRISDYNTKGLDGNDEDYKGDWARLVFMEGVSASKGVGGGSFGIGKAAAFSASNLRAVYYSTKNGAGETVFIGKARIASWRDKSNEIRSGIGEMGVMDSSGRVRSIRKENDIPRAFLRSERGTDINILGYYPLSEDWKTNLIESVLINFWASIWSEKLTVEFRDDASASIVIEKENLKTLLEEYEGAKQQAMPYYLAMAEGNVISAELPQLGTVKLFYALAPGFPREVIYMRQPKMRVASWKVNKLHQDYAAVLLCDNDAGNALLRALEPAAHDKWDADRENGKYRGAYLNLRKFITKELSELNLDTQYKPEDVRDLGRYLPDKEERDDLATVQANTGTPTGKEGSEESPLEVTKPEPPRPLKANIQKPQALTVVNAGGGKDGPGGESGNGKDDGGESKGGGGEDQEDSNLTRMETSGLRFRSIASIIDGSRVYTLILTPDKDTSGAIRVMASGEDADYPVTITQANDASGQPLEVKGAFVVNLHLKKDTSERITVQLNSNRRYALGVETHER